MSAEEYKLKRCLNPFLREKQYNREGLRRVSKLGAKILTISEAGWLCPTCRKMVDAKVKEYLDETSEIKGKISLDIF